MMDRPRSISGGGEDNLGIPDDMRCKRSDGKQWRCTAMSMPDKTVCEKHYFQAKKRTASAAVRANMKKAKTGPIGESDMYLESKSDEMDVPLSSQIGDHSGSFSGKIKLENSSIGQFDYSPEMPSVKTFPARNSLRSSEEDLEEEEEDGSDYDEESRRSYRTPPPFAVDSSRRSHKMVETTPMTESSDESSAASDDNDGQPCHQCRSNDSDRAVWCLKCDKRGYCEKCISTWYSDIPVEEIQRACPACRGTCSCRVCLRGDNLIKARIRDIPAQDKLQYLYSLLSAVLPMVKQIHSEQCSEVELEKSLCGNEIDLARTRLNADEQMCCNFCRIPIIDYHRHCTNCSYDLCLNCCKGIRQASRPSIEEETNDISHINNEEEATISKHLNLSEIRLNLFKNLTNWKANSDGSIPCPPSEYGGCSSSLLTLKRIFKMNWVAKLVKNVEEMVNVCKIRNNHNSDTSGFDDEKFLYTPSSHNVKSEGIEVFRMHWSRGKPVIVKEICDASAMAIWNPMVMWRGIKETADEQIKDSNRIVKAVDCSDWSEINISLEEFMKGYSEGRVTESGKVQLLKLKDWPSPSTSEEFLLYQRPDFVSKLPLLEFVHYKWGLLNVATKLPHYSLQNDVGPKIYFSYGSAEEIGKGDSTNNLHMSMRDMVFLLVHTCEVKVPGMQGANTGLQKALEKSEANVLSEINSNSGELSKLSPDADNGFETKHSKNLEKTNDLEITESLVTEEKTNDLEITESLVTEEKTIDLEITESLVTEEKTNDLEITESRIAEEKIDHYLEKRDGVPEITGAGALWDVFRRQDIPKLVEYINIHWNHFGKGDYVDSDCVSRPLYDGKIYLSGHHKTMLKEEFGVEPWSIEQHIGEAIFIPAGCPFQVRHLQSSVQLGLDFLSPESLSEAVRMSEEIRGLPNDHDAKVHILEVGKISLYAASSAIKEVRKLVLDPKIGPELGFEDPNLTDLVSQNLEKTVKRRQATGA